jgi:putative heme-binding domain-containing protein
VVALIAQSNPLSRESVSFLEKAALDSQAAPPLRTRAFDGLERASNQPDATEAALRVLVSLNEVVFASVNEPWDAGTLSRTLREEFIHDRRHARNLPYFEKLAATGTPAQSELAYAVLVDISAAKNGQRQTRAAAQKAVAAAWESPNPINLLRAVGEARAAVYADQVRAYLRDTRPEVAAAANYALEQIKANAVTAGGADRKMIGKLPYEEVLQAASKAPGDPGEGAQFFQKLGCVLCHTTSKSEPLKGPFLGDIAVRYKRPEIIESILRPNAQIAQGFVTTTLATRDGTDYDGFIVRESGDEIEIRNLAGATVIPKRDIVKRGTRPNSIMPEGLADQLTPDDLASLVAYLQSLKPKSESQLGKDEGEKNH